MNETLEKPNIELKEFTFDEKEHLYKLNGKPMTGVTTILGVIAKPSLIQWAANMACDHINDNFPSVEEIMKNPLAISQLIKEARTAHRTKKEKAGDIGTLAHKWIEEWIKNPDTIFPDDPVLNKMCENFTNWALENEVKFLESEMRVYSEKYWYAGTIDLVLEMNGKKYLGDLKTSSGIYDEHFYQTAAYQNALNEMGHHLDIVEHIIINTKKDGKMQVKTSTDYENNRKAFMGALAIYRVKNQ